MSDGTKIEWATATSDGNRVVREDGYVIVRCPSYPGAKPNGYVFEHRLVMARQIGRPLTVDEVVHHINGDRQDNRTENLRLTTNSEHASHHMAIRTPEKRRVGVPALERHVASIRQPRVIALCACGCGEQIETPDSKGRRRRFVRGHNQRGRSWRWSRNG